MSRRTQQVITENDVATVDAQSLVKPSNAALAVAENVDVNDHRGKENVEQGDITVPRLAIAQRTSNQIVPGKPEFIEGLQLFQMFNTMTQETYGRGPVRFAIVHYDKVAHVFSADNKIIERNVPLSDAKCQFGPNGEKPRATVFHQYLIVLIPSGEIVQLSFKGTQISTSKKLQGFQTIRKGPAWAGSYDLTSTSLDTNYGPVGSFQVKPAGPTPADIVDQAEQVYELLKAGRVKTAEPEIDSDAEGDAPPF